MKSTGGFSRTCSLPTSPSCRTSTGGSTRRATPGHRSRARRATGTSRSTWPVVAWGNRDGAGREALRGVDLRGLLPSLVTGRHPRPGAPGPPALRERDRAHQPPAERAQVTRMWPFRAKGTQPGALGLSAPAHTSPHAAGHDWASLPPTDGVLGEMQRTIDPESCKEDPAVQQPPHPFLEPLGHAVSAE